MDGSDHLLAAELRRIEGLEGEPPEAHRGRVFLLTLLGAAVRLAGPLLCLALAAAVTIPLAVLAPPPWRAAMLLALPLAAGAAGALLASRRHDDRLPPAGIPLDPALAPALFALLDELRALAGTPPIHRVLLTHELNASVHDVGPARLRRPTLLLGLPLLHALPPDELRAVLAHELGHLAGRHGRMKAWAWRVRTSWASAAAAGPSRGLRGAFVRWYVPRLAAWSFALARAQEREADALGAAATSERTMGDALTRVPLLQALAGRDFWPAARRRARRGARPQEEIAAFLAAAQADPDAAALLSAVLSSLPHPGDAHPPLAVRLRHLGVTPRLPPPVAETAARLYLGDVAGAAARVLDAAWSAAHAQAHAEEESRRAEPTAERDERRELSRVRLEELREREARRELEPSEAWEQAMIAGELQGDDAERRLLEALHRREPAHAPTLFELGRLRLVAGDPSGAALLEQAAVLQPALEGRCTELLLAEASRRGDREAAARFGERHESRLREERLAAEERSRLPRAASAYRPARLDEATASAAREAAERVPGAWRMVLAERVVQRLPERRAWLVGVERDAEAGALPSDSDCEAALLEALEPMLGGHVTCLVASTSGRAFLAALAQTPGLVAWRR